MMKELQELLGVEVKIKKSNKKLSLPYFMTCRKIYSVSMLGNHFILIDISKEIDLTISAMKKQKSMYENALQLPVAFQLEVNGIAMRNALVRSNIPFISLPGNVYIPFMGVVLQDAYMSKRMKSDKMMPATQMVFLELLYQESGHGFLKSEIASRLNLTKTSLTRATLQLQEMDLIKQVKSGKEIHVTRNYPPKEYYERARKYLINPVQKTIEICRDENVGKFFLAGENALGKYSSLNPPGIMEMAVYKGSFIEDGVALADSRIDGYSECIRLQLWKYDPSIFAKDGYVDCVSLACSLNDSTDERIEKSIEEMLEEL